MTRHSLLTSISLCVIALAGCRASEAGHRQATDRLYYPTPSQQGQHIAMGAGDALGWHLAGQAKNEGMVISGALTTPSNVTRPAIDPFTHHGVVGTNAPPIDPLAR